MGVVGSQNRGPFYAGGLCKNNHISDTNVFGPKDPSPPLADHEASDYRPVEAASRLCVASRNSDSQPLRRSVYSFHDIRENFLIRSGWKQNRAQVPDWLCARGCNVFGVDVYGVLSYSTAGSSYWVGGEYQNRIISNRGDISANPWSNE